MKYLTLLRLAFSMLPIIHTAVDQIEDMFPQGGNGAQKLAMVKNIIESAMNMSELGSNAFTTLWPMIASIVADIVALKKKVSSVSQIGGTI